ncbi:helix-turn-helix domain-containing protein [Acinetobacter haemolyticus]|uniref:helix-turn-helix domain-containing protein n=1 Tax=Acinetobacter haemolyticus TaxID=29430 RepID=UPI0002CEC3ED|nr:helix-turn-helix domain-containing protein [Acinetobacter haemolyticus]ENW20939.1 hypothetical protein F926_01714 [Acinetobacter haemolyticus NIPH 261]
MTLKSHLDKAGGVKAVAGWLGFTPKAIYKWCEKNELPRTEYTGETKYSEKIEEMSNKQVTKEELLEVGRPK